MARSTITNSVLKFTLTSLFSLGLVVFLVTTRMYGVLLIVWVGMGAGLLVYNGKHRRAVVEKARQSLGIPQNGAVLVRGALRAADEDCLILSPWSGTYCLCYHFMFKRITGVSESTNTDICDNKVDDHQAASMVLNDGDGELLVQHSPRIFACPEFFSTAVTNLHNDRIPPLRVSKRLGSEYDIDDPEKLRKRGQLEWSEYTVKSKQDVWLLGRLECSEKTPVAHEVLIYPGNTNLSTIDPRPYWNPCRQAALVWWVVVIALLIMQFV